MLDRSSMNGGAVVDAVTGCRRSVPPHPASRSAIRTVPMARGKLRIVQFTAREGARQRESEGCLSEQRRACSSSHDITYAKKFHQGHGCGRGSTQSGSFIQGQGGG